MPEEVKIPAASDARPAAISISNTVEILNIYFPANFIRPEYI
jgi:hypothetical protein